MITAKKSEFFKAFQIGTVCVCSYMVSYYMRNILSVTTPEMLSTGIFTKEYLGSLSSIYMLVYAIGQLFNGVIGDIIKPKFMIVGGMVLSGISSILFAFTNSRAMGLLLFAVIGFALSMLRGPLVKTISENTSASHSRVICTFFSCASFTGPLIAGMISMFFNWCLTFIIAGTIAISIGFIAWLVFTLFEKKGLLTYSFSENSHGFKNIFKVFSLNNFVFYMFVGALAEISAASITFWVPTYLTQKLSCSEDAAKIIFSAMSFCKGFIPFVSLFFYTLLKGKDIKMTRYCFFLSALFFSGMLLTSHMYLNVLCLLLAQLSIGAASSLLWSIYIPSQRKSGMVSTVNGVFDFSGYLFASIANLVFAHAIGGIGWNGIILVWTGMAAVGFLVSVFTKQQKKRTL